MKTLLAAVAAVLFVGCTEIHQTDAPTSVDIQFVLPGTTTPTESAGGPSSLTMTLDPPSITMDVGNNVSTLVTIRDGAGQEISPQSITVAGLNVNVAFLSEIDERTVTFTAVGAGTTSAIISASGLQRVIVITVN